MLKLSGKFGNVEAKQMQGLLVNNLKNRGMGTASLSYALILMQVIDAQWKAQRAFLVMKLGGNILDDLIVDLSEMMKRLHGRSQLDAIQVWDPLKLRVKAYDAIIMDDVTARNALGPHHFEVVPKLLRPGGDFFLLTDRQVMKDAVAKDFRNVKEFKIDGQLSLFVTKPVPPEDAAGKEKAG